MKIALIGTHGTGKTTVAHELIAELKKQGINAEFIGELARKCPLPINEKTTKDSQEWIIFSQYIQELELQSKCDLIVCDRSVLDGYVYYHRKFRENQLIENFVKEKLKDYVLLIKVPINEKFLQKDGIRSTDKEFQRDIDERFDLLLRKLNVSFETHKNLNKTVELIKEKIK